MATFNGSELLPLPELSTGSGGFNHWTSWPVSEPIRLGPLITLDGSPPIISDVSPPNGSSLGRSGSISFKITDAAPGGIRDFRVWIIYADSPTPEVIYDDGKFWPPFNALSSAVAIANGFDVTIVHNEYWSRTIVSLFVNGIDLHGNIEEPS